MAFRSLQGPLPPAVWNVQWPGDTARDVGAYPHQIDLNPFINDSRLKIQGQTKKFRYQYSGMHAPSSIALINYLNLNPDGCSPGFRGAEWHYGPHHPGPRKPCAIHCSMRQPRSHGQAIARMTLRCRYGYGLKLEIIGGQVQVPSPRLGISGRNRVVDCLAGRRHLSAPSPTSLSYNISQQSCRSDLLPLSAPFSVFRSCLDAYSTA